MKKGYLVHIRVDIEGMPDYSYPVFITSADWHGDEFHKSVAYDNYDYIYQTNRTLCCLIHMVLKLHKDTTLIFDAYGHYRVWQDGLKVVDIHR